MQHATLDVQVNLSTGKRKDVMFHPFYLNQKVQGYDQIQLLLQCRWEYHVCYMSRCGCRFIYSICWFFHLFLCFSVTFLLQAELLGGRPKPPLKDDAVPTLFLYNNFQGDNKRRVFSEERKMKKEKEQVILIIIVLIFRTITIYLFE